MNPEIFRANDIRAIVETELPFDVVEKIGRAYGTYLLQHGNRSLAVGCDVRTHSEGIKKVFIAALLSTGCDVSDIGFVPSPVGYFCAFELGVDTAAIVTASHNPKEYNGFKLGIGKSTLFGEEIQKIYRIGEAGEFSEGKGKLSTLNANDAYRNWMKKHFSFDGKVLVAMDSANATGALFATDMFRDMGCTILPLYDEVDGTFPNHHPDPTIAKNMVDLQKLVLEKSADVGIGFDGDSDRIGVLDEKARLISGDLLTALFAREVLKEHPGASVVFEVKSSKALEETILEHGGKPVMWKVGHSFLKKKMVELDAPLAGEVSGHIFFADRFYGFDDALYCAARVIEMVQNSPQTLAEMVDELPSYCATPEIRVDCGTDAKKRDISEKAVQWFRETEEVIDIDGVRILFPDGWGLVRASNTQPTLVTRFEAKTPERLVEIRDSVLNKLKDFGEIEFDLD